MSLFLSLSIDGVRLFVRVCVGSFVRVCVWVRLCEFVCGYVCTCLLCSFPSSTSFPPQLDSQLSRSTAQLGAGIYFTDRLEAAAAYAASGVAPGDSCLVGVFSVALGSVCETYAADPTLVAAPRGFDSVCGRAGTAYRPSDFEDNEFVVYSPTQQVLEWVVEVRHDGGGGGGGGGLDALTAPSPALLDPVPPPKPSRDIPTGDAVGLLPAGKRALPEADKGPTLEAVGSSAGFALKSVAVMAQVRDVVAQVSLMQVYENTGDTMVEARYVFPLDDGAAVCGFEAFINGKHVVGKSKLKEQGPLPVYVVVVWYCYCCRCCC